MLLPRVPLVRRRLPVVMQSIRAVPLASVQSPLLPTSTLCSPRAAQSKASTIETAIRSMVQHSPDAALPANLRVEGRGRLTRRGDLRPAHKRLVRSLTPYAQDATDMTQAGPLEQRMSTDGEEDSEGRHFSLHASQCTLYHASCQAASMPQHREAHASVCFVYRAARRVRGTSPRAMN